MIIIFKIHINLIFALLSYQIIFFYIHCKDYILIYINKDQSCFNKVLALSLTSNITSDMEPYDFTGANKAEQAILRVAS